jgi:H+-transporting ATPase
LAIGLTMIGHAVVTPLRMVILMITGDVRTMPLTSDSVPPSADLSTSTQQADNENSF